jgi:light-regulated signal transduction histidine kinase (bacteriophytochrome)
LFKRVVEDASYIHNLLDSIDSVVFTLDRELKILQVNKAWHEFIRETGRQPDENFLGMSVFESYGEGAPGDIFRSAGHQVLSGELRFFAQEFHIATRHGERMYQLTMNPMVINGAITGLVITQADITALKQSELTVKQNNERLIALNESLRATAEEKETLYAETAQKSREIEMRNKELDDFTYVVSHDLKEPLISIEGFSKILQLDFRDVITGDGRDHLDSIVGAATRMKALIDDLLMLSRVGRIAESFKPVSLNDVLTDVRTDMEFSLRQRNIDLQIAADLPSVYGSSTHLKIVFRNLIGNAIKFSSGDHPLIEVGFQNAENNQYLFYVRDNGIGIEPEFHNKIFVIFQRLHRREEYEGTGAGLAIVKKIVEMHRGKIWVESEKGKGSTFYFTIPKSLS